MSSRVQIHAAQADALVAERRAARAAGDFTVADRIRNKLAAGGVFVVDTSAAAADGGIGGVRAGPSINESRHAAQGLGCGWVRACTAGVCPGLCEVWSHKRRAYCGRRVGGVTVDGDDGDGDDGGDDDDDGDIARLFYCAGHIESQRLRGRVPCPFDRRHPVLLTKLSGHLRICQSKPGVSSAIAAGENGNAVPRCASTRSVHSLANVSSSTPRQCPHRWDRLTDGAAAESEAELDQRRCWRRRRSGSTPSREAHPTTGAGLTPGSKPPPSVAQGHIRRAG
jgi:hypothetical protein